MSDVLSKSNEFSWLRKTFWPVKSTQTKKILCFIAMLALALFNYTCLRINKDALIVTAYGCGNGVLPFLKTFFVLPGTLMFVQLYWYFSNVLTKKGLFYFVLAPFLIFFTLFALFINPYAHVLHASHATIDAWQLAYPRSKYLIAIIGNWGYALFYIWSELWGNVVISILFWGFANEAFSREESKVAFPLFASYSNVGLLASGFITLYFSKAAIDAKKLGQRFDSTFSVLACVVISAFLIAFLFWYLNEVVLKEEGIDINRGKGKKKVQKASLKESFWMVISSRYLLYVTILVLAYGTTANLVEVTWKGLIKQLYPNSDEYKIFMCYTFILTGLTTFLLGLFCKSVLKKFGWLFTALITPLTMILTSVVFYVFILYGESVLPASVVKYAVLYAMIIGALQNILTKGGKYIFFDPAIQSSYKPLDEDLRIKGKAAVDIIGGRAGKSLGSAIQIFVQTSWPSGEGFFHIFIYMIFVLILCGLWIVSCFSLSGQYEDLVELRDKEEALEAENPELKS